MSGWSRMKVERDGHLVTSPHLLEVRLGLWKTCQLKKYTLGFFNSGDILRGLYIFRLKDTSLQTRGIKIHKKETRESMTDGCPQFLPNSSRHKNEAWHNSNITNWRLLVCPLSREEISNNKRRATKYISFQLSTGIKSKDTYIL